MKLRYIMVGTLAALLLTGCGSQEKVLEKAKSEDVDFTSSIYEIKTDEEADTSPAVTVSEQNCDRVKKLKEILEKADSGFHEESDDESCDLGDPKSVLKNMENTNQINAYDILSSVYEKREDIEAVLKQVEQAGYSDLVSSLDGLDYDNGAKLSSYESRSVSLVRQGVEFSLSYTCYYDTKTYYYYMLEVQVPYALVLQPAEYSDLVDNQLKDGFYPGSFIFGGYMDRMNLVSSWDEEGNPYNKSVDFYFQDGTPVQLEITLEENGKTGDKVFTDREQETMTNLLTKLCTDQTAAKDFVESFTVGKSKSGTVGNCQWTLKYSGYDDSRRKTYVLTVQ